MKIIVSYLLKLLPCTVLLFSSYSPLGLLPTVINKNSELLQAMIEIPTHKTSDINLRKLKFGE